MALIDKNKKQEPGKSDSAVKKVSSEKEETNAEVSTKKETAVATRKSTTPALSEKVSATCEHPDILDAVIGADYGTFPSITATNSNHKVAGTKDTYLGKVVKFQPIVLKESWKVTPGSNDEEAKDYFCVSDDGEVTNDGRPLQDALEEAIEAGYAKASIKKYIDIVCTVVECKNEDFIGETVTLQLAPSSQRFWNPLMGRVKMRALQGKLKAEPFSGNPDWGNVVVFTSTATPQNWNNNDYTAFVFSLDD